jgi:uncharacterized protein YcbK (DUF882 family)
VSEVKVAMMAPMLLGALASSAVSTPSAPSERSAEARALGAPRTQGLASKKDDDDATKLPPLLATLAQLHTDERVMLDATSPPQARFDAMMADRVTGSSHALDAKLLGLLRALAAKLGSADAPRIELVSGFRSPKLNEQLRKKGHHVASHSQHSLGHACDFRVLLPGAAKALEPRTVEKEIRALGWDGGVGTYPQASDWFVHADVGPNRRWVN